MSKIYFSVWHDEVIDNRGVSDDQLAESSHKLPVTFDSSSDTKAFVGWDGFALFNDDVDVVQLAVNYARQYQEYSEACGRCAPGRWGGRILYDLLDKVGRGEGELSDLDHLKEIASTMTVTSKCEIGKTVPVPLMQMIEYFEYEFIECISKKQKSKWYGIDDSKYIANVTAPCTDMCPSHVDIPAYIEGVRDLNYEDSLVSTRQTMPLAHTCGRVCPHPCEDACRRTNLDESISIMELKRIGADWETDHALDWFHPTKPQKPRNDGKRVAIIGAGPAGLTAAYYLGLEGIDVTIFEELPVLGGEVAVGVPEYRMPIDKYNKDIQLVTDLESVTVIPNHRVSADRLKEIEQEFDATLLGFGARLSKKVRANNENTKMGGYWGAIEMLDKVNLWHKYDIGSPASNELKDKTVVCVGGGFTSMDVVRCSIREGAKKVVMLYRRDEKTIIRNTTLEEYTEAVEEGVEFIFHSAIEEIYDDGNNITKLKVNTFELVPDPNGGRAQLVKIEGGDMEIDCDYLIPAVSQALDLQILPEEWNIEMTSWASIMTNGKDYMTNRPGLFAAGDCEYGPMTIVNAVGQAKRAASVISRYIYSGEISLTDDEIMEDHFNRLKVYNKKEKITGWMPGLPREHSEKLDTEVRKYNNKEVNLGFTAEEAQAEAERCMRCYYIGMVSV
ncbi:MAG: FAD-dependent oxidoreductase [Campylobacteraceae bacterium]|jgi:formate dehydrogenase beta subunit|nr:FAD-dependent oxidoreductase [Campylobacteraceae bacterium]MBT3882671.1 FAD-dependent oxidoreductase [Campylobacteraceae bacterium]MBT4178962.1 FAD-dependent oxidoreductase [Campylobacteraceae bacterium]MBT4573039.1 FAD-dependent oxidoreductase [Campylobacteraceae bacterium]MBT4707853.1 FAD-dependent oxidoreductase [Campylobacteraceae bacterium]